MAVFVTLATEDNKTEKNADREIPSDQRYVGDSLPSEVRIPASIRDCRRWLRLICRTEATARCSADSRRTLPPERSAPFFVWAVRFTPSFCRFSLIRQAFRLKIPQNGTCVTHHYLNMGFAHDGRSLVGGFPLLENTTNGVELLPRF